MTAGEFAFLALGLVLGVATGAALIEVLRARPPAARQVRVTVSPNAIHARMSSTLADPAAAADAPGPAARGPGDRRWRDEPGAEPAPVATGRRSEDRLTAVGSPGTPVPSRPSPAPGLGPSLVAVPMSLEADPLTAALRATAAAGAVTAMAGLAQRPAARSDATPDVGGGAEGAPESAPDAAPGGAAFDENPRANAHRGGDGDGPCADARRVAEERCAVATRARAGASAAAHALRTAQRTYDGHVARSEAAAATADPRSVRAAKEQAQRQFHDARAAATTRDDVEAGARAWLAEINRINHETREAASTAEHARRAAAALVQDLERLAVEADAARISADLADEACVAAREAVADCDEATQRDAAARRAAAAGPMPDSLPGRIAAAMPEPDREFELAAPMASRAGDDAPILRILRGDREAMVAAVERLAGDDPEARRRWQARLGGLAEALIARSIEASAFEFPQSHPFWGPFDQTQSRDIAAGLSSLGFRFDGFGGWVDDRMPSQRDLSLAVGYAGLDPMRIRHWPTEPETRELLRDVRVAADEYVAAAAGGLSLGEMLTLLGRRADALAEVWNEWGSVRPVLLEAG